MISYEDFFSKNEYGKQYSGWREHINEYMSLIDMIFALIMDHRAESEKSLHNPLKGIIVTRAEAEAVSKGAMSVPGYNSLDIAEQRTLVKALKHIVAREQKSLSNNVFLPLCHIGKVFNLTSLERFCIVMCLIVELDRKYERMYGYLHDNAGEKLPTVGLVIAIFSLFGKEDNMDEFFTPTGVLMKYIMDVKQQNTNQSRLSRVMQLEQRIYEFLIGKGFDEYTLEAYIKIEMSNMLPEFYTDSDVVLQNELCKSMERLIAEDNRRNTAVYIKGNAGAGKKLQVRHIAKYLDMPLILIDAVMLKKDIKKLDEAIVRIVRYSILYQGILCITNFEVLLPTENTPEEDSFNAVYLLNKLSENISVLFMLSTKEWKHSTDNVEYTFMRADIGVPDDFARLSIWKSNMQKVLEKSNLTKDNFDIAELSNKFKFTPGMIEAAITEAGFEAKIKDGIISKKGIYSAAIRQSTHNLEKNATKVKPAFSWDDLIIPKEQKRYLVDACNQVKFRHIVLNKWGFSKKLPYGNGLAILFYGPPGTGKTMGAQVLANELGLEMYKVDLAQMVSKYIGETEKNLKEIFDEASQTSAILFFDEADSLFGKRGEVNDSHDKYANMETSYLLQRMEEYEGITILATNLIQNFDEAYRRRFKYMINFPMPDEETRKEMWENIFPEKVPRDLSIDFDFLSKRFEITGSNIKNIAVTATYLAAAENTEVSMKHIVRALKNEHIKMGKVIISQDLGAYGELLKC